MSESERLIELLPWDTTFFGFQVARVCGDSLSPEQARQIDAACVRYGVRCLYFLTGLYDPQTTQTAESSGFHYVDIRITLEHHLESWRDASPQAGTTLRHAAPSDLPVLEQLSGEIYRDTRFFYDRRFPAALSAELYRTWIRVSLDDPATHILIVDRDGTVAGFITCTIHPETESGQIGLVGVSPDAQGGGIGLMLVDAALHWFKASQAKQVIVVTQGNNLAAQRLYQRLGFITQSVKLWYHKWYEGGASDEQ